MLDARHASAWRCGVPPMRGRARHGQRLEAAGAPSRGAAAWTRGAQEAAPPGRCGAAERRPQLASAVSTAVTPVTPEISETTFSAALRRFEFFGARRRYRDREVDPAILDQDFGDEAEIDDVAFEIGALTRRNAASTSDFSTGISLTSPEVAYGRVAPLC